MTVKPTAVGVAAVLLLSSALLPATAQSETPESAVSQSQEAVIPASLTPAAAHPFAAMAGNWSGEGMIALTGDIRERLRCRAAHTHAKGSNSIALSIRCASDNYKIELTSNVTERQGQLSGRWSEASYGVSGSISGRMAGNRIAAMATGENFTSDLTVVTNGNQQTVSMTPKATYVISVQIAMNRR